MKKVIIAALFCLPLAAIAQSYGPWQYETPQELQAQSDDLWERIDGTNAYYVSAWFELLEWTRYKQFCYSDSVFAKEEIYSSQSGKQFSTPQQLDAGGSQYFMDGELYVWARTREVIYFRIPSCEDFQQWKLSRAMEKLKELKE